MSWLNDHRIQFNEHRWLRYHERRAQGMTSDEALYRSIQGRENAKQNHRENSRRRWATNEKINQLCSECRKLFVLMASGFKGKQKHRTKRNWYRRMKAIKKKGK